MDFLNKIITSFELHSFEGIKECFENGINPNDNFDEKPLVYSLINMYSRGPLFKECMKVFVQYGLVFEDEILLLVLLDDSISLDKHLLIDNSLLSKKYSLDCTFTPLYNVSLLHICAEYNHLESAKILVKHGADVNTIAGIDENGFGGQTPVFHTVNQHDNKCIEMLQYLISQKADLGVTVKGLIWGKGYDWETFIPAVNPISYAMMGLLRQFQRTEEQIYSVVSLLLKSHYGKEYFPVNIPNKYLLN
jgi:Ankyrin repeats (many copies)